MTKIYEMYSTDGLNSLVHLHDHKGQEVNYETNIALVAARLAGQPFGDDYVPPILEIADRRYKKNRDIDTMISPFLIFSSKALVVLKPYLKDSGQILDVVAPIDGVKGFHITRIVEGAINKDLSSGKQYPNGFLYNKITVHESKIEGHHIFIMKEKQRVFISEDFKRCVENNGLTGVEFEEISMCP